MARQFGIVRSEERAGRKPVWFIDCFVEGRRYKLRGEYSRRGKRIRFADEEAAQEALEEIRADIRAGRSPFQAISDFLPVGAPETYFQRHYRRFCKAKARQGREGQGRQLSTKRIDELHGHERRGHLQPLLSVPIQAINYGTLEDWRDWLFETQGLSPGSIHHILADVGTCLRWLARRGEIDGPPELPAVQVPEYAPRIPAPAAQERLLAAIPWEKRGLFLARGYMGLRPSEAIRANASDYDFERDLLTVHGKGWRVRYLPADGEVIRWVRKHHEPLPALRDVNAPGRPLFPNPDAQDPEKRWTPASARRVMLAAMKATGLRFKPNEALRHAFGTGAANRGVEIERIGHYLGHTDPRTTRRYAKLAGEQLVDVTPNRPRTVRAPKSEL
ncbi:MAG: tyrosine-type recombinase/integrase [Planctomycetota bacterium]|jgi:integrase